MPERFRPMFVWTFIYTFYDQPYFADAELSELNAISLFY